MNGEKNSYLNAAPAYLLNAGVALAIGLVASALIFGWFYAKTKKTDDAITVTGAAKKRLRSDLVTWSAGVTHQSPTLAEAYRELSASIPKVKQYLIGKGVAEDEITISSISTNTLKKTDANGGETQEIAAYSLSQHLDVRSNDVDKIAQIAREATELINQGILIDSGQPQYYYTHLGDLKIEMLGEAARDAKVRAEKIASSTGNTIGAVRSARMGVLQITAADSTDVSDAGISDTSAIDKDMTAVVNIAFAVE